jgi:hypothetical protein
MKNTITSLQALKQSQDIIILPIDGNLGPAIMDWNEYIQQVLTEQVSHNEASYHKLQTKLQLLDPFKTNRRLLCLPEQDYFK